MPDGSAEGVHPAKAVSLMELTSGVAVVVTPNTPAAPAENVVASALVMVAAV